MVELEGRSNLGIPFGVDKLGSKPTILIEEHDNGGLLRGSRLTPDQALGDYLVDHGLRIGGRLAKMSAIELVTTTAPGIRDLLTLGKIRSLEESRRRRSDRGRRTGGRSRRVVPPSRRRHGGVGAERADSRPGRPRPGHARITGAMPFDARHHPGRNTGHRARRDRFQSQGRGPRPPRSCRGEQCLARDPGPREGSQGNGETGQRCSSESPVRRRLPNGQARATTVARSNGWRSDLPLPQIELPFVFTTDLGRADLDALAATFTDQIEAIDQ